MLKKSLSESSSPDSHTGNRGCFLFWKRWSLRPQRPSAPSLRRFISGSFLTSAEPAPLLRLRPLRPPLPFLRRWCASILPSGDRQSGSRCAPFLRRLSLPCGQPASASHRLFVRAAAHAPSLRRFSFPSVSAELISGRFPSSPLRASNPSGDRGERYARPARHGSVPPPSTARIQPPQAPAEPAAFRLRLCAGLSRPSLPFAPAPSSARSRSAWVPTLRRLRISPLAPLSPDVLCRLRFSGLLAAPALASGCSVPLRGTASAGSGRTPFVLTPPLRPAQAQARICSASGQPARSLPPAAGVPQASRPASVVRSRGRLPSGSFFLRSLPGNLLPLRPSSAAVAAPATADRRACSRPLRAGSAPADCPPVRFSVCSLAAFGCMCSAAPQPASAGSAGLRGGSIVSRPPDRSFPLLRCIPLRRPAPGRSNVPFPRGTQARLRSIPLRSGKERLPHIASLCMWSLRPFSPHGSGVCGLQEPCCVSFRLCSLHRAAHPVFAPKRFAFPCGTGISILFTAFTIHAD